jgi:ribose-phosphate pyrophosphokinase
MFDSAITNLPAHRLERPFKIFAGSSNLTLAQKISDNLKNPLGNRALDRFSDGEIRFEINENVRGLDVFVIQSTCNPTNTNLMELLIMGDAFKRASVRSICAVVPYYGYARQDRKTAPRTPITAKLIADLVTAAGFNRLITVDLHAGAIQGFFNFPVDHLFGSYVVLPYLQKKYAGKALTVVSPDAGGTERARIVAKHLGAPLAIVDKRRSGPNEAKAMNLIGEVEGRIAILFDDMIDTAGTLSEAAKLLKQNGASHIVACATHGVFSGSALERIEKADFSEVVISDTIPLQEGFKKLKNLTVLSVAPLIGETIQRIQRNDSVSALF